MLEQDKKFFDTFPLARQAAIARWPYQQGVYNPSYFPGPCFTFSPTPLLVEGQTPTTSQDWAFLPTGRASIPYPAAQNPGTYPIKRTPTLYRDETRQKSDEFTSTAFRSESFKPNWSENQNSSVKVKS